MLGPVIPVIAIGSELLLITCGKLAKAVEKENTDLVLSEDETFLQDSISIIHREEVYPYPARRNSFMVDLKGVLDFERSSFLYSEIQGDKKDQEVSVDGL